MKKILSLAALSLPLVASAATNLLSNGSFEDGLSGWTVDAGVGTTFAPAVITYGPPGSAFGEVIPADDAAGSMSPDAVGTHGLYFVEDNGTQSVMQNFTVAADGIYQAGFSVYVPLNGSLNPGDAEFSLMSGTTLLSTLPVTTWGASTNGTGMFMAAGDYTFSLSFTTTGGQSIDAVVDRAYVMAVPEPETYALMLAGLAAVGFMARRRKA